MDRASPAVAPHATQPVTVGQNIREMLALAEEMAAQPGPRQAFWKARAAQHRIELARVAA